MHQVLAEVDAGEAGAAGVGEEAEEALMRFKVAGGIDQLHVSGREGSLVQGRPSPSLQGPAQASPAKTSLIIPATTSISSRKWPSGAQLKTSSSEIGPLQENKDHSTQSDLSEYRCSNKN